jgi:hypothetical protein
VNNLCLVIIKFSVATTGSNNLVMLTALRIVNIFPVSLRRIKTIVPLEAHELLHWKLLDGISCRHPPYSNATLDVKVQHLGTSLSRNHLQVLH